MCADNYGGLPLDARARAETAEGQRRERRPPRPVRPCAFGLRAIAAVRIAAAVGVTCGGAMGSSAVPVRWPLASALCFFFLSLYLRCPQVQRCACVEGQPVYGKAPIVRKNEQSL